MEGLEILSLKVKKAVEDLHRLNTENHKLKIELDYLRRENEQNKKKLSQYIALKRNLQEITSKIERIVKKIDTVKVL